MNKLWFSGLAAAAALVFAPVVRAADSPVAPFLSPTTNIVIHVDMGQIDPDAFDAMYQKAVASSPQTNPAKAAHDAKEEKKDMAKAKKWIGDFETAGGKDLYIVVDLSGLFLVGPGEVVVPMDAASSPDALAKIFPQRPPPNANGGQASPMMPDSAVVGHNFIFSTTAMIQKLKSQPATTPVAHNVLSDALAAGNNGAVQIVISPASIRSNPILGMMMPPAMRGPTANGAPPTPPMGEPEWNNVAWVLITVTPPPKESGSVICQCNDAASAAALAKLIEQKMNEEQPKNPQVPKMDAADQAKLKAAFKPTVSGTQVKMGVDQNTFDNVILPIMVKMSQRQPPPPRPQQPMPGEPMPGQPMPGGDNGAGNGGAPGGPNSGGM